jgi:transcriptional regulator with XRE-family HTH domain
VAQGRLNTQLRERMRSEGFSDRRFADKVGVSVKTVTRWLADADYRVRFDNAQRAADVLGCTPHDLWPRQYPYLSSAQHSERDAPFTPNVYASRSQVPVHTWLAHFQQAEQAVDILVFAATFLFDTVDGFVDTLVEKANRGVAVRMLVADPLSPSTTVRGQEELIGDAVIARCRTTVELLSPYSKVPGFDIRLHQTALYASVFRVDSNMMVNFHLYGSPGRNNPVMIFQQHEEPRLWSTLQKSFDSVWQAAVPL